MSVADAAAGGWPPFPADPDNPGWLIFRPKRLDTFAELFGVTRMCVEADGRVRCRFQPEPRHRNIFDGVHGGFAMAIVDQVLFFAPHARGIVGAMGGVTVAAGVQFMGPLGIDHPLDAVVEILRETGRMVFMRGLIEQQGVAAVSFTGTIRKASPRA